LIEELNKIRLEKTEQENRLERDTLKLQKLALEKSRMQKEYQNMKLSS
jgi:hypothetical protein